MALEARLPDQRPVQTVVILFFQLILQQVVVEALEAVHLIPAEMVDQAAAQEETQQAQAALETRPLLAQVKETMVDQHQAIPAAVEEAVQVRQEALELPVQIIKAVMEVMERQTPLPDHPLLMLVVAVVALIQVELALEEQAAVGLEGYGQFLLQPLEQRTLVAVVVAVLMDRQVLGQTVVQA